ncbi:MAG: calcium/sodium antiporter [Clostridia bacterium]|nr:calcium/sodium antiporter [Clostridia bacterium]
MEYFLLSVGLFLLIKGADVFVDGASAVAGKFGVPSFMIGLTVVSLGTSAPEAAISISASISGSGSISLGNVIGSNIFNLLMVIGVTSLFTPLGAKEDLIRRDMPVNIIASGALAIVILDGVIGRIEAIFLLAALGAYLFFVIKGAIGSRSDDGGQKQYPWVLSILMILGGLASIMFGGDLVVDNARIIAANFGMSELLIGLTVVAFGTSLPELVTSIVAVRKGETGIAVGNAVGSCLFNILFILGITGVIKPLPAGSELIADTVFLAIASVIVYIFAARKRSIGRLDGALCVILYAIYTAFIIMRAL